jgi:hypothetical protein
MRKTNCIRISKEGSIRLNALLSSLIVNPYHKTLLRGIVDRYQKRNLSKSDCDIFEEINKQYIGVV